MQAALLVNLSKGNIDQAHKHKRQPLLDLPSDEDLYSRLGHMRALVCVGSPYVILSVLGEGHLHLESQEAETSKDFLWCLMCKNCRVDSTRETACQ
jgi:hypothetical protein